MSDCPLNSWMAEHGLTQQQMAQKLGAPQTSISAYLAGRRGFRLPRFQKLSSLTGIPLGDLVEWTAQHQRAPKRRRRS